MNQFLGLLLNYPSDPRVAMSDIHGGYSRDHVQVAGSLVIPQILTPALHNEEGFLVVVRIEVVHVESSISEDLLVGWASVRHGFVGALGELGAGEDPGVGFSNHGAAK